MKAILYVPYSNGDCVNGFVYEKDDLTSDKYCKLLTNEYLKYRNGIDTMMRSSYGHNISHNPFVKENNTYKQQSYIYNDCNCNVYNIKGEDAQIEELINYYNSKEEFIIILEMFNISKNIDLEIDMKMWIRDSAHILESNKLTDEEKIFHLPKKDFKLEFPKEQYSAIIKDCKLIEKQASNVYAIIVKHIFFLKNK